MISQRVLCQFRCRLLRNRSQHSTIDFLALASRQRTVFRRPISTEYSISCEAVFCSTLFADSAELGRITQELTFPCTLTIANRVLPKRRRLRIHASFTAQISPNLYPINCLIIGDYYDAKFYLWGTEYSVRSRSNEELSTPGRRASTPPP